MLRSLSGLALAAALSSLAFAATAQTGGQTTPPPQKPAEAQSSGGLGPKTTDPSQIDKGQNMILPSAGQSGQSAAPTMVFDCKAKPEDCTTPATPTDKTTAPAPSAPKP
ncbi:hypothetical protein ASE63_15100 [Bosea sp. Root381]|uniref:hypothetical protein n=1 Tax=Bosea sp. Root381 TaxID=1736524 RepID=UPI0006F5A0F3|nr:hypothetical protein [Bosea sp. Root381]KRE16543.1 hypothetical protein ASE63_15100 [Bosea sp. Root381]